MVINPLKSKDALEYLILGNPDDFVHLSDEPWYAIAF